MNELKEIDLLKLLDEAQAIERQLRQQKDELQNQLSRIAKILRDFGVVREPQECIEAWLQRSLAPAALERLATELAKDGFLPVVSRCRTDWHCQLQNMKLGFYPGGSGGTAVEAIESAAKHPLVQEIING